MKQINQLHVYHLIYSMYRNLYRKFLLIAPFIILCSTINAQAYKVDGTWTGKIFRNTDSSAIDILFTLKNSKLISIHDESKTQRWFDKATLVQQQDGESILLWWTYNCEFGIQSKVYKITPDAIGNATISWWKYNVDYSQMASTPKKWELAGTGFLNKNPLEKLIVSKH